MMIWMPEEEKGEKGGGDKKLPSLTSLSSIFGSTTPVTRSTPHEVIDITDLNNYL